MVRRIISMLMIPATDALVAWPVDFNLTLKSFEKTLQGVRNLVQFALSSSFEIAPQILFVSSIGLFNRELLPSLLLK